VEIRGCRGARHSHRIEEHPDQPVRGGITPRRQRQPAAGTKHACALRHGAFGARELHDGEVADDGVEGCVCERQLMRVRATEVEVWASAARTGDHRLRDVDADHRCFTLGSVVGHPPRPCRHV
jgi:hypothetical protein